MPDGSHHPSTYTPRALKWTIFLGATALVVYLCLWILGPFLNVIAWSAVLAITFYPLRQGSEWLTHRLALLGGFQAFGILGIVLGPVLFAIAASVVDVLSDAAHPTPEA